MTISSLTISDDTEALILSNAIILDNESMNFEGGEMNNARVAWKNYLDGATLTASFDQANVDNLFDHMTTTFWNAGTGTVTVDIVLGTSETLDCAAIAAGNWADAGTVIEIYSDAGITKVAEISGLKNGQPFYFDFDPVFTQVMQIRFISVGDLFVGQVLFGESLKFPVRSSVGLQLGKFNNNDKVIGQVTDNNAFGANSTVARSRNTVSPFKLIPVAWIESDWVDFSNEQKGKPIWFSWDSLNKPLDVTFGHWSTDTVKYDTSFLSSVTLTVKGVI